MLANSGTRMGIHVMADKETAWYQGEKQTKPKTQAKVSKPIKFP
jgi:hypothetical protein